MLDPYQPKQVVSIPEEISEQTNLVTSEDSSISVTESSAIHVIDSEPQLIDFKLRDSQGLKGWTAVTSGFLLIAIGVHFMRSSVAKDASGPDAIAVEMLCSFPALIGLLFLRDGVTSILRGIKRAKLGSEARWNADFPGRPRQGVNDSAAIAKKVVVNFLWGQLIMIPGIYLGVKNGLSGIAATEKWPFALLPFGLIWYVVAMIYTINKLRVYVGSRNLSLQWQQFPIFLAHPISLTLTVKKEVTSFEITSVMFRCIQETTIVTGAGSRGQIRRAGRQLYCDTISRPLPSSRNTFELSFAVPDRGELQTDLLADDPIFWCLTVEGTCEKLPIDASFLLPVYAGKKGA
jgi:hypothetical protein